MLTLGYGINLIGNVALLITATAVGQEMTGLILAPASGVIQTVMQIGIAFGVTVVGLVFFTVLGPSAPTPDSYTRAFTVALIVQPALALLALLLVPALSPRRERKTA